MRRRHPTNLRLFQHTAARRRLAATPSASPTKCVSTHSRPKAAGFTDVSFGSQSYVSTHSRPKAADAGSDRRQVSTERFNTQPPEGGCTRIA